MPFYYLGAITAGNEWNNKTEILYAPVEETMKCVYLRQWRVSACRANNELYVPSVFQLQEYCKTKWHKKCPFYVKDGMEMKRTDRLVPVQN